MTEGAAPVGGSPAVDSDTHLEGPSVSERRPALAGLATGAPVPPLLAEGVTARFKGVIALDGVSFRIERGSVSAVIGPNGAGKTSLFNSITGIYRPQSGSIKVAGKEVIGMPAHKIARLSVARTFQNLALFSAMSVLDNIMLGRYLHGRAGLLGGAFYLPRVAREEARERERAEEVLGFLELARFRSTPVGDLPYGIQKRVELGRALAQEPELLLLDEPMAGMGLEEKSEMAAIILDSRDAMGTTVLLVEHDMGVVMDLAEQIVVLDFGRKIADGTPSEVQRDPAVITAYLGTRRSKEGQ